MKTLRAEHPTFFFRSASSFITSESLSGVVPQAKGNSKTSTDDAVGREPLLDYLHYLSNPSGPALTITLVGVTNVRHLSPFPSSCRPLLILISPLVTGRAANLPF